MQRFCRYACPFVVALSGLSIFTMQRFNLNKIAVSNSFNVSKLLAPWAQSMHHNSHLKVFLAEEHKTKFGNSFVPIPNIHPLARLN